MSHPLSRVVLMVPQVGDRVAGGARWIGRVRDCTCVDAWAHDQDRDLGDASVCPATLRRRADAQLVELRVWLAAQADNEALIEDHGADLAGDLRSRVDGLGQLLTGVTASELAGALDGDGLMGTVLALEDTQRRLDAVKAAVLGALVTSGATESEAGLGVKRWKAHRSRGSDVSVARELRAARTAGRFEAFAEALGEGQIGVEHLLALDAVCNERTIDGLIELQPELLRFAKHQQYRLFVNHLRHVVAVLDPDGREPDCGDRDTAAMGRDLEGHLHLRLEASGHNAVEVEAIINAETDRQYRAAVAESDATGKRMPDPAVLRARAVVELIRRGAQPNPKATGPVTEALLPVTVDGQGNPVAVHTPGGDALDPHTAAVLICDAYLQPVVIDENGNPLNLGRTSRFFTPDQRKAMTLRDGGCVFPGCDQPASRCDCHHRTPWQDGGLTNIGHGAMLCRRHHGLVHRREPWTLGIHGLEDLPPDLADAHRVRAASAGLEPATEVLVWRSPKGRLFLAQNATDHRGPAPPRRTAA